MALFGSDWSTYSDLALAEATIEAAGATDRFGPSINGSGTKGKWGISVILKWMGIQLMIIRNHLIFQ